MATLKRLPTRAVRAMASTPQKQTRRAPRRGEAPPMREAVPPRRARRATTMAGTA